MTHLSVCLLRCVAVMNTYWRSTLSVSIRCETLTSALPGRLQLSHLAVSLQYIRSCIIVGRLPHLMLVSKDSLYSQLPASGFVTPSYRYGSQSSLACRAATARYRRCNVCFSRRTPQPSPCPGGGDGSPPRSLWAFNTPLRVRLLCATYVNVNIRDIDKVCSSRVFTQRCSVSRTHRAETYQWGFCADLRADGHLSRR